VVIAGVIADTAFVDGIKQATGMDASVYSTDVRSATTLLGPDGKSRLIGIKENNAQVKNTVLEKGESYKGVISLLNQPYLAVYAPLKNYDNTVAGMLLVGRPHTYILETAGRSIQLTFLIAALMIALSVIPAYIVARHIARQVR
jgi:methyl-accepting chemotaxis protein